MNEPTAKTQEETCNEDCVECPYCGYEHEDYWEWREGTHDVDCGDCGRTFTLNVERSTTYTATPKATP